MFKQTDPVELRHIADHLKYIKCDDYPDPTSDLIRIADSIKSLLSLCGFGSFMRLDDKQTYHQKPTTRHRNPDNLSSSLIGCR